MENDELLHKWINNQLSPEELEAFKRRPEYESLVAIYKNTEHLNIRQPNHDAMLQDILKTEKLNLHLPSAKRRALFPGWIKYAAAILVIIVFGWWFWSNQSTQTTHRVASSEKMEGQLPDQSTFVLNAVSTLSYSKKNWLSNRILTLEGEAFFDAKKGSKFKVMTSNGIVEVLGTQFNVRSRKELLEVSCRTGKVVIQSQNRTVLDTLNKNEAIRISANQVIEAWTINGQDPASWIEGISKFRTVPLRIVLEELERQYAVHIDASQVSSEEIISCNFQHKDLELALRTTLTPLFINYKIEGNKIILSSTK